MKTKADKIITELTVLESEKNEFEAKLIDIDEQMEELRTSLKNEFRKMQA